MKKAMLFILFFVFSMLQVQAAPQYILIKQNFWGTLKLKHVEKPTKNLNKWYYDSKNDTYYLMKTFIGLRFRLKAAK
jgi:hypothetical protein